MLFFVIDIIFVIYYLLFIICFLLYKYWFNKNLNNIINNINNINNIMNNITVYDEYTLNLNKYPRQNTQYETTDIVIITFLMHQNFLQNLSETFMEAITNFNLCKEYYYIFKFNNPNNDFNKMRKYSAKDIMFLITETNNYFLQNSNMQIQLNYLKKFHFLDQVYYFYIRNKNFYTDLFKAIHDAKVAYFERREYRYKFIIPIDFYNFSGSNTYSALELLEINAYVQFLMQRKIIKELPIPKYIDNSINKNNIMDSLTNIGKKTIDNNNIEKIFNMEIDKNNDSNMEIDDYEPETFNIDEYFKE
jgi:hypothetical protein